MKQWTDVYPHRIYASVLLLDDKIESFNVGENYWDNIGDIYNNWKIDKINDYKIHHVSWEVNNREEHNEIFTKQAKNWLKQWRIADDYIGNRPY